MTKAAAAVLVLSSLAVACAPSLAPHGATIAPIPAPTAGGETETPPVPWSVLRPLAWADFKAAAPSEGVEGARTVYLLNYESRCHGSEFQFQVTAVFIPDRSWVKPVVIDQPSERIRVLGHEQTHFNLTEVYARRMRKYFSELYEPCRQGEEQLRASVDRFVREEAAAQQRYDDETRYGLTAARQAAWDRDVREMLASLDRFARLESP